MDDDELNRWRGTGAGLVYVSRKNIAEHGHHLPRQRLDEFRTVVDELELLLGGGDGVMIREKVLFVEKLNHHLADALRGGGGDPVV